MLFPQQWLDKTNNSVTRTQKCESRINKTRGPPVVQELTDPELPLTTANLKGQWAMKSWSAECCQAEWSMESRSLSGFRLGVWATLSAINVYLLFFFFFFFFIQPERVINDEIWPSRRRKPSVDCMDRDQCGNWLPDHQNGKDNVTYWSAGEKSWWGLFCN